MNLILDLLSRLYDLMKRMAEWAVDRFLRQNIFEKIVILLCIPGFIAVSVPVARYYIFESYFYINNPFAVYMIGVMIVMFAARYFTPLVCLTVREIVNMYYLAWLVYLHLSRELSRAPYELTSGYYLNIAVPAAFMAVSLLAFVFFRDE
ncbi:MAG TPA: hypothetical protein P5295_02535 [Spirochaetota bacterium]|nr:hypothetical protein [Spirochaetota bacterium]